MTTTVQGVSGWHGWAWYQDPEHADKIEIQRRDQKNDVKRQSISKAAAARTTDWVFALDIIINANAQDKIYRQNTARLAAIGVKEAITVEITVIVGSHITNPILSTTDG